MIIIVMTILAPSCTNNDMLTEIGQQHALKIMAEDTLKALRLCSWNFFN